MDEWAERSLTEGPYWRDGAECVAAGREPRRLP